MRPFDEIYDIAADRQGGVAALEARLDDGLRGPAPDITNLPEDRWLATMTKCVFQAGFQWKVIQAKWNGFEAAFHGFDIGRNAMMNDEGFDALIRDTRIVRNGAKIQTVRDNAALLLELRAEGGAGKVLGGWPSEDYIGLLEMLKKRGSRLGGATGQIAMRFAGRDAFILSQDVTARLIAEGVIDKPATSKGALKNVQEAFNIWGQQSDRSLTEMSRILALSL
ncbi:DNA-3-methyladenine glycosylase I [Epibacterium ulvae]|uniref:DNA-3-methyladenine glycosylase I n=1 Tax=Epibacterium ulvae TaxID=1156985 RepID=UPI001BFC4608|nr:DNA-3-methyladenine glycosylase I [Epibacterium ulvae]MBT8152990.1 DNA-3-methyladenine glycosylase I [Epibacterium ulvae]